MNITEPKLYMHMEKKIEEACRTPKKVTSAFIFGPKPLERCRSSTGRVIVEMQYTMVVQRLI
jgi:hypothetical protein